MKVGTAITVAAWTEVTNTNAHEISTVDGKYVEVVEVTAAEGKGI